MPDDDAIVTHAEPAARDRSNYILRLNLTQDGLPGRFEQMWVHTADQVRFELCCIPFFTYGLSLGDVVRVDHARAYAVVAKSGHRTIRIAIRDQDYLHREHETLHRAIAGTGSLVEFRGHRQGYGAIDIANEEQASAIKSLVVPLAERGTLIWEWADPVVPD